MIDVRGFIHSQQSMSVFRWYFRICFVSLDMRIVCATRPSNVQKSSRNVYCEVTCILIHTRVRMKTIFTLQGPDFIFNVIIVLYLRCYVDQPYPFNQPIFLMTGRMNFIIQGRYIYVNLLENPYLNEYKYAANASQCCTPWLQPPRHLLRTSKPVLPTLHAS